MTNLLNILLMAPQGQGGQQSGWYSFLPLVLIIVVFLILFGVFVICPNHKHGDEDISPNDDDER